MDSPKAEGLRERKMRETRHALEAATLDLAIEVGLAQVTVEQIAERADVSPRTFFNYFPTKEDALLGRADESWQTQLLAKFPVHVTSAGVYAGLKAFLIATFHEQFVADELLSKRMRVIAADPELAKRHFSQMTRLLDEVTLMVARLLEAEDAGAAQGSPAPAIDALSVPSPEASARARMLLLVCSSALKYTFDTWLWSGRANQGVDSIAAAFTLLENTVATHLTAPERESSA